MWQQCLFFISKRDKHCKGKGASPHHLRAVPSIRWTVRPHLLLCEDIEVGFQADFLNNIHGRSEDKLALVEVGMPLSTFNESPSTASLNCNYSRMQYEDVLVHPV